MGKIRDAYRPAVWNVLINWFGRRSMKVKIFLGFFLALISLVCLRLTVKNRNHFFVASETVHAAGILVLIYKLIRKKTCSGLSLKSQELTAIFLAVRLICSTMLEGDIHTVLDFATLVSTLWVIYTMRFKLKSTYIKDLDDSPTYYLVVPSAILALLIHPYLQSMYISRVMWAFVVYLESVSVLPQLRLMQKAKMIEPFTGHYVFALGVSRFLSCAHWIFQVYDSRGHYLFLIGSGYFWGPMVVLAEIVQTFILADFCYYYAKTVVGGQLVLKMPV